MVESELSLINLFKSVNVFGVVAIALFVESIASVSFVVLSDALTADIASKLINTVNIMNFLFSKISLHN